MGHPLRKKVRIYIVLIIVIVILFFGYYHYNNSRIQSQIVSIVSNALTQELGDEANADPSVISSTVPPSSDDAKNLFLVVNHKYRILNMYDSRIRTQFTERVLLHLFGNGTPSSGPVFKVSGIILFSPADDKMGANVLVQYVDPFGIVRSIQVIQSVPLKHWPLQ